VIELGAPWWLAALALIGILALASAVITLFFALGRRPSRITAAAPPAVDQEDDFLLALAGAINAPTRGGGGIQVLRNGDEFFPAILEAIRGARRSVTFFTYIFEDGRIAAAVLDALAERARAGVQVRLLLDGFGAMTLSREKLEPLQAAGGRVRWFRPARFGKLTRFHKRNHRRAIVIDGTVGFTGGAAVGDKWLGNAQGPEHWRDDMFRVTGPLALSVQSTFSEAWSNATGEILAGEDFYPLARDEADVADPSAHVELGRHVNVITSPSDDAHPLRKLFWLSFMAARERIWVTSPYFVPDSLIREALLDRVRGGVDVRLLLPNELTDAKPIRWASQSYYDELLRGGIRIFEYQPTFLHAKSLVVDGRWAVIGSANMDIRSKELNEENAIGIMDPGFCARLEEIFLDDLRSAREIQLDEVRRRGRVQRLLERAAVLFAEQF
jgi:cardiolipin synthase A/B